NESNSIIVLAPMEDKPDIMVIKTVLAITNHPSRKTEPFHIVAELTEPKNIEACNLAGNNEVTLVLHGELISRITAQTCRQSGLSLVYTELLDFDGCEIYFADEKSLTGKTFKEAILAYDDSSVIGLKFKDGSVKVNPPMDTILSATDSLIVIAEDNSKIKLSNKAFTIDSKQIISSYDNPIKTEKTLILGWNRRGAHIISELDNYVAANSQVTILADIEGIEEQTAKVKEKLVNQSLEFIYGDTTDRDTLESIDIPSYDHIIILCYSDDLEVQEADAKTLIALLHLRNMAQKRGTNFSIVSEMLDIKNKELAEITKADDFIISDKLVSLMLSQLSENKELKLVFDELFNDEGAEIYLKPASQYITEGSEVDFYTVMAAASQRNEVAIGYRLNSLASDAKRGYGVLVNPIKSEKVKFTAADKIIVLSEDES
ncbi:potassium transporter TrkA, partial [bacterium]